MDSCTARFRLAGRTQTQFSDTESCIRVHHGPYMCLRQCTGLAHSGKVLTCTQTAALK
jgi:hypothetical protein